MKKLAAVGSLILSLTSTAVAAAPVLLEPIGAVAGNGSYGDFVVQSFTATQDNSAGLDIYIGGTSVFEDDVDVFLYADAAQTLLLASDSVVDHPRNTIANFRWAPVALVPGDVYYLRFDYDQLRPEVLVSNSFDSYTGGEIIAHGGGNPGFTYKDIAGMSLAYDPDFTNPDPNPNPGNVPEPSGLLLILGGLSALGLRSSRAKA